MKDNFIYNTEINDGDPGGILSDSQHVDDWFDEVNDQLPVVAPRQVVVTDASRVVNHERDVGNACCKVNTVNIRHLNLKKSSEIVFVDSMWRHQIQLPSLLEGIPRVCSLKILGITINSHFSVSEHVSCIIGKCAHTAQTIGHALNPARPGLKTGPARKTCLGRDQCATS